MKNQIFAKNAFGFTMAAGISAIILLALFQAYEVSIVVTDGWGLFLMFAAPTLLLFVRTGLLGMAIGDVQDGGPKWTVLVGVLGTAAFSGAETFIFLNSTLPFLLVCFAVLTTWSLVWVEIRTILFAFGSRNRHQFSHNQDNEKEFYKTENQKQQDEIKKLGVMLKEQQDIIRSYSDSITERQKPGFTIPGINFDFPENRTPGK